MENQVSVALDVDGVLANFYAGICKKYGREMVKIDQWSIPWINDIIKEAWEDEDFWANLPVLSNPKDIDFDFDMYLTHLPLDLYDARLYWLKKNGFPSRNLICAMPSQSKGDICKEHGIQLLVDDKPGTIIDCQNKGILGVQFVPHYHSKQFPIVSKIIATGINGISGILKHVEIIANSQKKVTESLLFQK